MSKKDKPKKRVPRKGQTAEHKARKMEKMLEDEIDDYLDREGKVVKIAETLDKYPTLTPRERDFARRYATEFWRSNKGWARMYGVSDSTIRRMLSTPAVVDAINEIKSDFAKYTMAKQMLIMELAADKIIEVLRLETNADTAATLYKTGMDVFKYIYGYAAYDAPRPSFNFDLRSGESEGPAAGPVGEGQTVDLDELERRMKTLKQVAAQVGYVEDKKDE